MSGFFPIMMFGLPGAALAMYSGGAESASSDGWRYAAFCCCGHHAFLTGVTEPLEFLFMFLAPLLYLLHAVLTGISLFRNGAGYPCGLLFLCRCYRLRVDV